jgi:DUF2905 family protein
MLGCGLTFSSFPTSLPHMRELGRLLIILGIFVALVGVVLATGNRLGIGRLPGDIAWRRGNFGCYFPLMTSIILSVLLTLVLWLFRR